MSKVRFTEYDHARDFHRVRDFLSASYARFAIPRNWLVDRWNFVFATGSFMNGLTVDGWSRAIGLWEGADGAVVAMANEEEGKGDVFFQFASPRHIREDLCEQMFAFAEARCGRPLGRPVPDGFGFRLRVPDEDGLLSGMARRRDYRDLGEHETIAVRALDAGPLAPEPPPQGYGIEDAGTYESADVARCHMKAFGYEGRWERQDRALGGFARLPLVGPDWIPGLNLALRARDGRIAAFCGCWLDSPNSYCILEPVGTAPEYRRMGLGTWLVREAGRRAAELGAERMYVGSDLPFYLACGFRVVARQRLWEWRRQ